MRNKKINSKKFKHYFKKGNIVDHEPLNDKGNVFCVYDNDTKFTNKLTNCNHYGVQDNTRFNSSALVLKYILQ